jgi:lysyl endopeptidase
MRVKHVGWLLLLGIVSVAMAADDVPRPTAQQAGARLKAIDQVEVARYKALDLAQVALEDQVDELNNRAPRYAIPHKVELNPVETGRWEPLGDGRVVWRYRVVAAEASSLNFGFTEYELPKSATLWAYSPDFKHRVGPYTAANNNAARQLWTPVILGDEAVIEVTVLESELRDVKLKLSHIGQGYRFFGRKTAYCKSGTCNTDVACIADDSPWQQPRRATAAISEGGSRFCTGSLVNNTANDQKMLFATATHCTPNPATLVAFWNFESPTCRTPGSSASGNVNVGPVDMTSTGAVFRAATNNPFAGSTPGGTRSDWTLVEFNTPPPPAYNVYWAGWDRTDTAHACSEADDCASVHHPDGDEKRITFIETAMSTGNISSATGVHWFVQWDSSPSIARLPNLPPPVPTSVPPSVTEPGSSGSPLYNADQRLVGVLSGGASACGVGVGQLNDLYGKLAHAWDGTGITPNTAATRMRDWLDPGGTNPNFLDGRGVCTPPATPAILVATPNGDNRIDLTWDAVPGAETYFIYRGAGACPGSGAVQIGQSATNSFSDTDVSGLQTYNYRVSAYDEAEDCASPQGTCASATAAGICTSPPNFAGLTSAVSAGTAACAINLAWSAGSANCSGPMVYNVYRSTTPGFTPDASSLLESCVAGTSLADTTAASATNYEYVLRAEDVGADGGTGQCGGREETNLVRRLAAAGGPDDVLFNDDVEGGPANFTTTGTGAGANFAISTSFANSPTQSWSIASPTTNSDRQLNLASPINVTTPGFTLSFFHRINLEDGFDGGVLEYSLNGTNWFDILAGTGPIPANPGRIVLNGYTDTISSGFTSAISGRQAWSGVATTFIQSRMDLSDFAGQTVQLRWRHVTDSSVARVGWAIDDIRISAPTACGASLPDAIFDDGFELPPP